MTFDESKHPRDAKGQFSAVSISEALDHLDELPTRGNPAFAFHPLPMMAGVSEPGNHDKGFPSNGEYDDLVNMMDELHPPYLVKTTQGSEFHYPIFEAAHTTIVPVAELRGSQYLINKRGVREYIRSAGTKNGWHEAGYPPSVLRFNGELVIYNGHHRATAAALLGQKWMSVELYDLDEALHGDSIGTGKKLSAPSSVPNWSERLDALESFARPFGGEPKAQLSLEIKKKARKARAARIQKKAWGKRTTQQRKEIAGMYRGALKRYDAAAAKPKKKVAK